MNTLVLAGRNGHQNIEVLAGALGGVSKEFIIINEENRVYESQSSRELLKKQNKNEKIRNEKIVHVGFSGQRTVGSDLKNEIRNQ
jgi:hypothetical protein